MYLLPSFSEIPVVSGHSLVPFSMISTNRPHSPRWCLLGRMKTEVLKSDFWSGGKSNYCFFTMANVWKTRMYDIHHNCFWGQAGTIYLNSAKYCTKVNFNLCKWTQICLLCKLYSTREFGWGGDVGQASWLGLIRDTPWFPTDHNHCHDHHILLNKNWHRMRTITFANFYMIFNSNWFTSSIIHSYEPSLTCDGFH